MIYLTIHDTLTNPNNLIRDNLIRDMRLYSFLICFLKKLLNTIVITIIVKVVVSTIL